MTSAKNISDQKNLVAEKLSATGWRHSATGDVIRKVSATMLTATGVSATGFNFQRSYLVSATGVLTFCDRFSGRWKSCRRSQILIPVAECNIRSLKARSLKASSQILFWWHHRSLNDVIRSQIQFLRPIFFGRWCFLLTACNLISDHK